MEVGRWRGSLPPRSELGVRVVPLGQGGPVGGLDEDALHGFPQAVLAAAGHGVHLPLAVDGPSVLLARHRQRRLGGFVAQPHGLGALPQRPAALHGPLVQVVALALFAERAHFL